MGGIKITCCCTEREKYSDGDDDKARNQALTHYDQRRNSQLNDNF